MLTSMPHVAWFFLQWEGSLSWYNYVTSYGIAVGIDILIAWLSFVCTSGKVTDIGFTVAFISLLSILSDFANFLFAKSHAPADTTGVWNIHILWGATTTGYITPIIVSAIPFFNLAYTFMLSRLTHKHVDLVELEERLMNERAVKDVYAKYKDASAVSLEEKSKHAITGIVNVGRHALKQFKTQPDRIQECATDELEAVYSAMIAGETENDTQNDERVNGVQKSAEREDVNGPFYGLTGRSVVSLEKASLLIGCEVKHVQALRNQGKLKHGKSKDKITVASIKSYLANRRQPRIISSVSGMTPDLKTNGHGKDTDPFMLPILGTNTSKEDE